MLVRENFPTQQKFLIRKFILANFREPRRKFLIYFDNNLYKMFVLKYLKIFVFTWGSLLKAFFGKFYLRLKPIASSFLFPIPVKTIYSSFLSLPFSSFFFFSFSFSFFFFFSGSFLFSFLSSALLEKLSMYCYHMQVMHRQKNI